MIGLIIALIMFVILGTGIALAMMGIYAIYSAGIYMQGRD